MNALSELSAMGARQVYLCSSDFFSRADAFDIASMARSHEMEVWIFTGITANTPNPGDALKSLEIAGVWLTLSGARRETHDAIAGAGSFDRTLELMHALRGQQQLVRLNAALGTWDLSALADLVELASQLECPITSDALRFPHSPSDGALPRPAIWIMPDGTVRPCRALGPIVGEVPRDSISDIWRQSLELRALAGARVQRSSECRQCLLRADCFRETAAERARV
jgi:radical SAM protein with 4Fe4S-binding SPASM domain